jgi:hypothetical protein
VEQHQKSQEKPDQSAHEPQAQLDQMRQQGL